MYIPLSNPLENHYWELYLLQHTIPPENNFGH